MILETGAFRRSCGFIGFMLSPLSWWNDLFVNVPLAVASPGGELGLASGFRHGRNRGLLADQCAGLVLLHKGTRRMLRRRDQALFTTRFVSRRRHSLLYTALVVALIKLKVLKPVTDYFQTKPAP